MPGPSKFIKRINHAGTADISCCSSPTIGQINLAVSMGIITADRAAKLTSAQLGSLITARAGQRRKSKHSR